jgi:hypothetical protein
LEVFYDRAQRSGEISVWMHLFGNVFLAQGAQ